MMRNSFPVRICPMSNHHRTPGTSTSSQFDEAILTGNLDDSKGNCWPVQFTKRLPIPLNSHLQLLKWQSSNFRSTNRLTEIVSYMPCLADLLYVYVLEAWSSYHWYVCAVCHAHPPGPRNWQPRALTAAQRLAESCWGFWCCRMSSVTVRSPSERPARTARTRPSSSTSWQFTKVTSFLCIGRLSKLGLRVATPAEGDSSMIKHCTCGRSSRWYLL